MSLEVVQHSEVAKKTAAKLKEAAHKLAEAQIAILDAVAALEMFEHNFKIEEKRGAEPDAFTTVSIKE